jgi:hypothetical protein
MIRDAQQHCVARLEAHEHGDAAGATGQVREAA